MKRSSISLLNEVQPSKATSGRRHFLFPLKQAAWRGTMFFRLFFFVYCLFLERRNVRTDEKRSHPQLFFFVLLLLLSLRLLAELSKTVFCLYFFSLSLSLMKMFFSKSNWKIESLCVCGVLLEFFSDGTNSHRLKRTAVFRVIFVENQIYPMNKLLPRFPNCCR